MSERARDIVWDTLEELFGPCRTSTERGRRNRAVRELREAGASADEIRTTFRYCQSKFTHFREMAICANLTAATTSPTRGGSLVDLQARLRERNG